MKNLQNLEIINISTKEGKLVALVSYQDTSTVLMLRLRKVADRFFIN
jgi:hypothetical protein